MLKFFISFYFKINIKSYLKTYNPIDDQESFLENLKRNWSYPLRVQKNAVNSFKDFLEIIDKLNINIRNQENAIMSKRYYETTNTELSNL